MQRMLKMSFTLQTTIIIINPIRTKAITVPIKHCLFPIHTAIQTSDYFASSSIT